MQYVYTMVCYPVYYVHIVYYTTLYAMHTYYHVYYMCIYMLYYPVWTGELQIDLQDATFLPFLALCFAALFNDRGRGEGLMTATCLPFIYSIYFHPS